MDIRTIWKNGQRRAVLTFGQAMDALEEGKKVRAVEVDAEYLYKDENGNVKNFIIKDKKSIPVDLGYIYKRHKKGFVIYEEPKKKKEVYQWRYKNKGSTTWRVSEYLMTEEAAKEYITQNEVIEKHAGPFEVEE